MTMSRDPFESRPWLAWVLVLLVVLFAGAVRWRLLDVPLERDEGEYAYAGQLILDGLAPYAGVYNMKLPGTYAAYAALQAVFGQSVTAIRLGVLLVHAGTVVLLFLLTRRLFGPFAGLMAAVAFATLTLGVRVQGVYANAEQFVLPLALAGLLLVLRAVESRRLPALLGGGLALGGAVLMKQHAAAFVVAALAYLVFRTARPRRVRLAAFAAAVALPYLATGVWMWGGGVFERFWFWTVRYAVLYAQQLPLSNAPTQLAANAGPVVGAAPGLWLLAAAGLVALPWLVEDRGARVFIVAFALCSFLATCPGLVFRPHYFLLTLPAAALAAAVLARGVAQRLATAGRPAAGLVVAAALVLGSAAQSLLAQRRPLFAMTPAELSRYSYALNPFPESPGIAEIVRSHSRPDDRVAILGSEPQILFYAQRRSATGYIYMYPLMEQGAHALSMQEELIREVTAAAPEVLVYVHVEESWLRTPESHARIFEWFARYRRDFRLVGAVTIRAGGSRFFADVEQLGEFNPTSGDHVTIWKRRRPPEAAR